MKKRSSITAVIIDDEPLARDYLRHLLKSHNDITIVGEAANGNDAVKLITKSQPNLIFLDIQMPGQSGLEVMRASIRNCKAVYIFVTAFDQYALAAFDLHAVDYLLKPFEQDRFDLALSKARGNLNSEKLVETNEELTRTIESLHHNASQKVKRLALKTSIATEIIDQESINWIESEAYLLHVHTDQKRFTITGTLAEIEAKIDPASFLRIHRRIIVNIDRVKSFRPTGTGSYLLYMKDGTELPLSRRRKHLIESRIAPSSEK